MNKAKFKFGDKAFYDNFLVVVLGVNQTTDNEFEYFVVDEKERAYMLNSSAFIIVEVDSVIKILDSFNLPMEIEDFVNVVISLDKAHVFPNCGRRFPHMEHVTLKPMKLDGSTSNSLW